MSVSLSIVVPAYNEAGRLIKSLHTILDYLNKTKLAAELIVVDDGSDDDTLTVAKLALEKPGRIDARLITYQPNRGKGYAVRCGLLACQGESRFSQTPIFQPRSRKH